MGVYHLAGLGKNPGAVIVPLTYIFFKKKRELIDKDEKAKEFFSYSGEKDNQEKNKGIPEGLIVFSSKEVIDEGERDQVVDQLCRLSISDRDDAADIIKKYLKKLIENLKLRSCVYSEFGVRYFYLIRVDINNYDDCYKKIYLTMKQLKDKEVHVNLIGGTNQINLALMMASAMTAIPSKLYYVFENKVSYLHPSKVTSFNAKISAPPENWFEIPLVFVSLSELIGKFKEIGLVEGCCNVSQIKNILNELGLGNQFIAKLRTGWLKFENEEKVTAGESLKKIISIQSELDELEKLLLSDSNWKMFEQEGWLKKIIDDGKEV